MQSVVIEGVVNGWFFRRGNFTGRGKVSRGKIAVFTVAPGAPFLRNGTVVRTDSPAWEYLLKVERQLPVQVNLRWARRYPVLRVSYVVTVLEKTPKAEAAEVVRG